MVRVELQKSDEPGCANTHIEHVIRTIQIYAKTFVVFAVPFLDLLSRYYLAHAWASVSAR